METVRESVRFFIAPGQLLLFENALANPDLIQASTGVDCTVTIVDSTRFPLDELERWPVFRLTASDIKLNGGPGLYYIYVIVPRPTNTDTTTAFIGYSTVQVDVDGLSPEGVLVGNRSFCYYPAGTVSAHGGSPDVAGGKGRVIRIDLGRTPPSVNLPGDLSDFDKIFQIDKVDPANPASWLLTIKAYIKSLAARQLTLGSGASAHTVSGIATSSDSFNNVEPSDSMLATTAWVKAETEAVNGRFIRKDIPDSTDYLLQMFAGAEFGHFIEPLATRQGAQIDSYGHGKFTSLSAQQMTILELIINKLTALAGDFVMTESGTIDDVKPMADNTFVLYMHRKYDTDVTDLDVDDILRANINDLLTHGRSYMGWYRVISKDPYDNTLVVVMYPDADCPGGTNHTPIANMVVHRWGNATNTTRQRCWYMSSPEGRIVYLTNVYKPIVDESNYASFYGLPVMFDFLKDKGINPNEPYLYVRGLIAQDVIHVDYQGHVVPDIVDRGPWQASVASGPDPYLCSSKRGSNGRYETHEVWRNACKYRCLRTGTREVPKWNAVDWAEISGDPTLYMYFDKPNGDAFVGPIDCLIIVRIYKGVEDITADVLDADIEWFRNSGDPAADLAWSAQHANEKKQIRLTDDDCPGEVTRFTCRAFVRTGDAVRSVEQVETINM